MKEKRPGTLVTRILWFNLILVFLPAAGILFFDTFERQLLRRQEQTMVQQGRFAAAALASTDLGPQGIGDQAALEFLTRLRQRHESRIRILDGQGNLLADSAQLGQAEEGLPTQGQDQGRTSLSDAYARTIESIAPQNTILYRLASAPVRFWRRYIRPRAPTLVEDFGPEVLGANPEVRAALEGRYGARTRVQGSLEPSVVLYSAIPIISDDDAVLGVVLVSQSTWRVLVDVYEFRLDYFRFVLLGAVAALGLSVVTALSVFVPLRRLAGQARSILDPLGRLRGVFPLQGGNNELGMLSRSLHELSSRLGARTAYVDALTQDLAHEMKNPTAALGLAISNLRTLDLPPEAGRFLDLMSQDAQRLTSLLSGMRTLVSVDMDVTGGPLAGKQGSMDLAAVEALVSGICQRYTLMNPGVMVHFVPSMARGSHGVPLDAQGLTHVLENLVGNALDFTSSIKREVEVTSILIPGYWECRVRDFGPGVPLGDQGRLFDRFFSTRKGSLGHTGLGLAIVKSLVEGCGGSISYQDAKPGAMFVVSLPLVVVNA